MAAGVSSMELLEGRVAIITGGSGALGRAAVEYFLIAGAKVAVPYIVDAEVPLLHQRLGNRFPSSQILMRKCDVGVEEQISKLVDEVLHGFGKLDILVNLVGGFWGGKPIAETTLAEWQSMFDLNLKPTFLCCRAAVPAMKRNGYGRIVSVSSRSGLTALGERLQGRTAQDTHHAVAHLAPDVAHRASTVARTKRIRAVLQALDRRIVALDYFDHVSHRNPRG